MKNIFFAIFMAIIGICTVKAETPPPSPDQPAVLAIFNEKTYRNPNVDATIIDNDQTLFKRIIVIDDNKLTQEIHRLFDIDRKRPGVNLVEKYSGGEHKYLITYEMSDGSPVNICLYEEDEKTTSLWISITKI